MNTAKAKDVVTHLLQRAGIGINGQSPWDLKVYDDKFFYRALVDGSLGVGESYVDNWWDCLRLDEFFSRALQVSLEGEIGRNKALVADVLLSRLFNPQSVSRAFNIAHRHYNLGNTLFSKMLDKRLVYTCAYWKNADSLDDAQEKKLILTCDKLKLRPGMKVLDIGCGWGSFAKFAAERYDVHVTGITVSSEQADLGRQLCTGLPVEIRLMDYRALSGKFDRIVSLGMFEHVGYKNYRTYMKTVHRCLTDNGIFLLHTIGGNTSMTWTEPWLNKYIFPGSMIPAIRQIGEAVEGLFVMEDWHNFGPDYDKTLMAWYDNFTRNWEDLKTQYDTQFYRMWCYYLLSCAGSFRARKNQLWQIVFSKKGLPGYVPVR